MLSRTHAWLARPASPSDSASRGVMSSTNCTCPHARGEGVAAALIDDAEARLAQAGVRTAWLACAIGNERAARFYEKRGWQRAGTMMDPLDAQEGISPLEVWRYEKNLL